jgi:hypothetical protein
MGVSSGRQLLFPAKNNIGFGKKLIAPLFDLVGINIELLGKLAKCLLTANGRKRNLRLENGCVITAWTSCHYGSSVKGKVYQ